MTAPTKASLHATHQQINNKTTAMLQPIQQLCHQHKQNQPKHATQDDNKWKGSTWSNSVNGHRKQAIYQDIMNGAFHVNKYTSSVPEGHCVYHG